MKKIFTTLTTFLLLLSGYQYAHSQTSYRVIAFYAMEYDGSQFVREGDSIRTFFAGSQSYTDIFGMEIPNYVLTVYSGELNMPTYPEQYSIVSLPCDSSVSHGLNASATIFDNPNFRTITTKDANGNIIELLIRQKSGSTWENDVKETYTYNTSKQITEYVRQRWESGAWVNKSKETSIYNGAGKLEEFTRLNWTSGTWENSENYLYEYDISGNCILSIYREASGASSWSNIDKTTISYDVNNHPDNYLFEQWESGSWKQNSKVEVNYNSNGDILDILSKQKSGSIWVDDFKETYTYTGTKKSTCIQESFDGTVWNKMMKIVYSYGGSGKLENVAVQQWDDPNSEWVNIYRLVMEYNSLGLNNTIYSENWNIGEFWEKTTDDFKFNFFYESYEVNNIPGLDNNATVNIYPNPSSDVVNVSIDWKKPQSATLSVYDIEGRIQVVKTLERVEHTQTQIDISELPAGNYYLRIATPSGQMTKGFQVVR